VSGCLWVICRAFRLKPLQPQGSLKTEMARQRLAYSIRCCRLACCRRADDAPSFAGLATFSGCL
ncbi:hypothetical protein, partial [Kingella oralis]|uniref:hypothetical protein n=1 Tax=Kingella oralis TaxID=505 RepID=UPI003C6FE155